MIVKTKQMNLERMPAMERHFEDTNPNNNGPASTESTSTFPVYAKVILPLEKWAKLRRRKKRLVSEIL